MVQIAEESWESIPPTAFDWIHATRVMTHVLKNSENAVQGLANKEIVVSASYDGPSESVIVLSTDNGVGMTADEQSRAFYEGYTRKVGDERGSGLGLAFCRNVMIQGGGEIRIAQSQPDLGTTMEIRFPRAMETRDL